MAGGINNQYFAGSGAYGAIPNVPDPTASAAGAIQGNLGNLGGVNALAGNIDTTNQNQLLQNYNMAIPNYSALTGAASGVTGQELAGKVPQDVIDLLQQQGAERGVMTGSPLSPNSNAAFLKALGLTSLGQEQAGFGNLGQLVQQAPKAPLFDQSSMLVNPVQEQDANATRDIFNAAPNPEAAAKAAMSAAAPKIPSTLPWWAQGGGYAGWLGPGTTGNSVSGYHTPAAAGS
jgi:hypothetical protein